MVLNALATLPPKSRAVVVLRYWVDLSVDQVAAILGRPIKADVNPYAIAITP